MEVVIKRLDSEELLNLWKLAFQVQKIYRTDDYYFRCLEENKSGTRVTLFASIGDSIAGCAHLKYKSEYPHFYEQGIPEINDLNVFPEFRRRGIANRLLEEFERIVRKGHKRIGIGVGLYRDYGAAQRIYCRRGYIPDGNGLVYNNVEVEPGTTVQVDDDLNLYFIKQL
ncbi:GNAT family N-acetyltransferase [Paenibacillus antri]|uniref:GNAT family N-acetyltransferase n=1 Tax=Paenibacillus antri TaxID=2582848 RepID=A0A5R9G718_9BACL|nr:GNAT family N-acetyltransferase [Paenibacillus antri]TLS52212.1 GNAT family N-acetyltransferase [Paenibacillus antri]